MENITLTVKSIPSLSATKARANALQVIAQKSPELIIALGAIAQTSKTDAELLKMLNNPLVKRALK